MQGKALKLTIFDIYVVNFDLFVFFEGVIFHNLNNNIKCVVWYGDSRFQRFLMYQVIFIETSSFEIYFT